MKIFSYMLFVYFMSQILLQIKFYHKILNIIFAFVIALRRTIFLHTNGHLTGCSRIVTNQSDNKVKRRQFQNLPLVKKKNEPLKM